MQAQDREAVHRIRTVDRNEFVGRIVAEDAEAVQLETERFGTMTIQRTDILSLELIGKERLIDGILWFDNPQATRYLFAPSGHGLKRGESYYQNVWILFNQVTLGVTDYFSMSAGMVPLFLFAGSPTPVWVNPKFSIPVFSDSYHLGVGSLIGTVLGDDSGAFGILYGVNTLGDREKNVSLGLGWGFGGREIARAPTITVSGMFRTGPRGYLLTENYLINAGGSTLGLLSFGGRRIINRLGLDFALVIPFGSEIGRLVAVPWLGLTIPMGKRAQPSAA